MSFDNKERDKEILNLNIFQCFCVKIVNYNHCEFVSILFSPATVVTDFSHVLKQAVFA